MCSNIACKRLHNHSRRLRHAHTSQSSQFLKLRSAFHGLLQQSLQYVSAFVSVHHTHSVSATAVVQQVPIHARQCSPSEAPLPNCISHLFLTRLLSDHTLRLPSGILHIAATFKRQHLCIYALFVVFDHCILPVSPLRLGCFLFSLPHYRSLFQDDGSFGFQGLSLVRPLRRFTRRMD